MDDQLEHPGPHLPVEAVRWMCGDDGRTVALLGARTAAVAAPALTEAGHDVHPVDDLADLSDRCVDVLVLAALPDDLAEAARPLRPGGQIALVRPERDRRIPWARKLDRILGGEPDPEAAAPLVTSDHFGFVSEQVFRHWQHVNHISLSALVRAEFAGHAELDRLVSESLALYADYGRGADGMQLPWVTTCHRATVVEEFWSSPRALDEGEPTVPIVLARDDQAPENLEAAPEARAATGGASYDLGADGPSSTSDDLLLIDFR